ncbi:MAG: DMT family transporter [Proteobacteria bacterium]|nr:DMT family transporter [Pseudomonadota bacterium]
MAAGIPRGPLLALTAGAALISLTGVLVKFAQVPPTVSGFWRMLFGGLMLSIALTALRQWRTVRARDVLWMLPPALAFATDLFFWHRSILVVGPGLATLLGNLQVFLMALAGVVWHRERLGPRFLLGLAMAFGGLWLLVGQEWRGFTEGYRIGVLYGAFTAVCYAVYMLSFRHAQRERSSLHSSQLLAISSLLSALVLAAMALGDGERFAIPDTQTLLALLALGLVGQCLGWVLIARAMPKLPASLVGLLLLLQPVLAFLMDVILFHRATRPVEWLGLALSLAGIFVGSLRGAKPAPVREDDEADEVVQ